ncbi:MAG: putative Nudix hydrolase NudL [Planctomycetes bacterium]|nr:putative Nudix hydrolase NudL [Planctomycetota bacterium]
MILDDRDLRHRLPPPVLDWRTREGLRDAAVLLPLVQRPHGDVLVFTQRRADLSSHAGQISFPGGGREGGEDALACALRETEEEIGLPAAGMDVLGRLPDRISIAGHLVAAFVARVRTAPDYRPLESEVAEVFELRVGAMTDASLWSFRPAKSRSVGFTRIPALDLDGRCVWGLTGVILRDFLRASATFDPGD